MRPELMQPFCGRCGNVCREGWIPALELDPPRRCLDCMLERRAPFIAARQFVAMGMDLFALGVSGMPVVATLEWLGTLGGAVDSCAVGARIVCPGHPPGDALEGPALVLMWIVFAPLAAYLWRTSLAMHREATGECDRTFRIAERERRRHAKAHRLEVVRAAC